MKRGELWWVDFEPAVGTEVRKTRPAVIVSNDASPVFESRSPVTKQFAKCLVTVYRTRRPYASGGKGARNFSLA